MNPAELGELLPEVAVLAEAASKRILQIYDAPFTVREKSDASPLTEADEVSEALILDGLRRLTPDIPIIAEEALGRGEIKIDQAPPRFWLVDPLDGTREFVSRNGEFSVSIGLVVDRRPVLGVLRAPALDTCWMSAGPATARVQRGGSTPAPMRARRMPATGAVAVQSRSHGDRAAVEAFAGEHGIAEIRACGSALKFGMLAEGKADLYPRFGPTMEWDTCAGHAILEAAGGRVETLAGGPLLYGKPDFRNPDFVARGAA
jgi:3'(2'), 5'-bisphosphate nucleotidase